MSATTKTSLINKALTLCGATPIVSITDNTENARKANRVYDIARRSILSECLWSFATTRATLSVSAVVMPFYYPGEGYVYVRPSDCLKIFATSDPQAVYKEEGDLIISDTQGLGIKYTYDLDDPSKYQGLFVDAFGDKLCAEVSYAIINSASKAEAFELKYQKVTLQKAMSANSQVGTPDGVIDNAWELAKFSNGSPGA